MSRGEFIQNSIWSDPAFETLSLEASMLYVWSFTNPRCNMAGLYEVSERAMLESKVPGRKLMGALDQLAEQNMAHYCEFVFWVRARVKRLHSRGQNYATSIARDVALVDPHHPLRVAFLYAYRDLGWLEAALKPLNVVPYEDVTHVALESQKPKGLRRVLADSPESPNALQCSAVEPSPTSKVKADEFPANYPAALRAFVDPVKVTLTRIATLRPGAMTPTTAAVARALMSFPDRDFLPIAEDYEHWLAHGTGQGKAPKDVVQGYRNQLERKPSVSRKTQPGGATGQRPDTTGHNLAVALGDA